MWLGRSPVCLLVTVKWAKAILARENRHKIAFRPGSYICTLADCWLDAVLPDFYYPSNSKQIHLAQFVASFQFYLHNCMWCLPGISIYLIFFPLLLKMLPQSGMLADRMVRLLLLFDNKAEKRRCMQSCSVAGIFSRTSALNFEWKPKHPCGSVWAVVLAFTATWQTMGHLLCCSNTRRVRFCSPFQPAPRWKPMFVPSLTESVLGWLALVISDK